MSKVGMVSDPDLGAASVRRLVAFAEMTMMNVIPFPNINDDTLDDFEKVLLASLHAAYDTGGVEKFDRTSRRLLFLISALISLVESRERLKVLFDAVDLTGALGDGRHSRRPLQG
jgi:hypothetical protein